MALTEDLGASKFGRSKKVVDNLLLLEENLLSYCLILKYGESKQGMY